MELALARSHTATEWIERLGRRVSERGQGEYDNYTALAVLVHEATDADVDTIDPTDADVDTIEPTDAQAETIEPADAEVDTMEPPAELGTKINEESLR